MSFVESTKINRTFYKKITRSYFSNFKSAGQLPGNSQKMKGLKGENYGTIFYKVLGFFLPSLFLFCQ